MTLCGSCDFCAARDGQAIGCATYVWGPLVKGIAGCRGGCEVSVWGSGYRCRPARTGRRVGSISLYDSLTHPGFAWMLLPTQLVNISSLYEQMGLVC